MNKRILSGPRRKWPSLLNSLAAALLVSLMAGCHASQGSGGSPASAAASANAIQSVQNNPNIPPQAKANIIKQLQSNGPPSAQPGAPNTH